MRKSKNIMKVCINTCFGGFGLSNKAKQRIKELNTDFDLNNLYTSSKELRSDPVLIQTIEELKEEADGKHAELKIIEVPDDVKWHISEYDGREHVAEDHRTWG